MPLATDFIPILGRLLSLTGKTVKETCLLTTSFSRCCLHSWNSSSKRVINLCMLYIANAFISQSSGVYSNAAANRIAALMDLWHVRCSVWMQLYEYHGISIDQYLLSTLGPVIDDRLLYNYCKAMMMIGVEYASLKNWNEQKNCNEDLSNLKRILRGPYKIINCDSLFSWYFMIYIYNFYLSNPSIVKMIYTYI